MWTFEQLVVLNTLNSFIALMVENYLIRKVAKVKNTKKYFWVLYLGLALLASTVASWLTLPGILSNGFFDYDIAILLLDSVNMILTVWLHRFLLPGISKRIIFFLVIISGILNAVLSRFYLSIGLWLVGDHVLTFSERNLFYSLQSFLLFVLMWQIYRFISKSRLIHVVRKVFQYPKMAFFVAFIVFFQQVAIINILEYINLASYPLHFFISVIGYLTMFAFSLFLIREYLRDERLRHAETLLAQQQSYMEHLETVQQDLRKIHHDYKNIAAGLYTQVETGDVAAAQDYISKEFLQIDQGLELSLQQHNQLLNVEVSELKTLLMTKILQAEKVNVRLTIEVMDAINQVPMEMADLLRCVGILLDNAIEAAAKTEEKEACLILLKEKTTLTLIVKNTVNHPVNLQQMWEAGYSTKGSNRGLGLANLKEILQRYQHVVLETRVQEQWFNQILIFQD